jgi:hypothetical protein
MGWRSDVRQMADTCPTNAPQARSLGLQEQSPPARASRLNQLDLASLAAPNFDSAVTTATDKCLSILLDYEARWSELEQSSNPFAVVIMAHLSTKQTADNPQRRLQSKLSLVRGLYERGYTRNQILELFRLIEWMMVLPEVLDRSFRDELRRYQEERRMPYITGFERDGMVKNARESVIEVLETRFELVSLELCDRLNQIEDLSLLKQLHKQSITIGSVEELQQLLRENTAFS